MGNVNDLRIMRERAEATDAELTALLMSLPARAPRGIFQVYDAGSKPTTVPGYFATHPVQIGGTEDEGMSRTGVVDASVQVIVLDLGPTVPANGDILQAIHHQGRWISLAGGIAGGSGPPPPPPITIPGCTCTAIPAILSMTPIYDPLGAFQACTIRWGPLIPEFLDNAGSLGDPCFMSDELFYDVFGNGYHWNFVCVGSFLSIRRVFVPGGGGGSFIDAVLFQWSIIGTNTCAPFNLNDGTPAPGYDPAIEITMVELAP